MAPIFLSNPFVARLNGRILNNDVLADNPQGGQEDPLAPKLPHFAPKAKRVIYLHMSGSPSQLDLFDHKPKLQELDGKPCPESLLENERFAFIKGIPTMLGTPYPFHRHGRSGIELSELLPHLGEVIDDVAVVQTLHTEQFNHAPAQLFVFTGAPRLGRSSMGSWITYGQTDDIGYHIAENPVSVHDIQATILDRLGLKHKRLTYNFQGRDFRLTDVGGKVVNALLA